ncbi:MAG: histidine phosphatase family protein [Propioniciclava sp.]
MSVAHESDARTAGEPPVRVYLARHGQTMLNRVGRVQGWSDSPLTVLGREQATELGRLLLRMGANLQRSRTADMVRHQQTASIALAAAGVDLVPERDERLREAAFGEFEGARNEALWDALASRVNYPDSRRMLAEVGLDGYLDIFDQLEHVVVDRELTVETSGVVAARAIAALTDLATTQRAHGGGDVLVVSSGLTIVSVLRALGFDLARLSGELGNGALSVVEHSGAGWRVLSVNDPEYRPAPVQV